MSKSHLKIFNLIAPIYSMFFNFQVKYYKKTLKKVKNERASWYILEPYDY